jgi:hypothetical protein
MDDNLHHLIRFQIAANVAKLAELLAAQDESRNSNQVIPRRAVQGYSRS